MRLRREQRQTRCFRMGLCLVQLHGGLGVSLQTANKPIHLTTAQDRRTHTCRTNLAHDVERPGARWELIKMGSLVARTVVPRKSLTTEDCLPRELP